MESAVQPPGDGMMTPSQREENLSMVGRVHPDRVQLVWLLAVLCLAGAPTSAHAGHLRWSLRVGACEPTALFYSAQHRRGARPCCATIEGVCPGGVACPANGVCPNEPVACQPTAVTPRPNVILMYSDDQGECHWGSAGECRSVQSGTPIPVPATPNLDLLSGYGTVFPVVHDTSAWCFPSINSLITGRYQKSFGGQQRVGTLFATIPKSLRSLGDDPLAAQDPYDGGNRIGGYCTFQGGKFTGSIGDPGFDAIAHGRLLGRVACVPGGPGQPPACGTAATPSSYAPAQVFNEQDLYEFLDGLEYRVPDVSPPTFGVQHFFAWYAPRIPHQPLRSPPAIDAYLFGDPGTFPLGGLFSFGRYCTGGACPPFVNAFYETNFGSEFEFYGNQWWIDDNIREIREYLARVSAPHCVGTDGRPRFDVTTPAQCSGTWASAVTPDLTRNTVLFYLTDNGWFLPHAKHNFTENGYRTRLLVFDPQNLPRVPSWDPRQETAPPAQESWALGHSTDLLPTILGFARNTPGSEPCPLGSDGTRCDGHDLRPWLATAPGGPAAPETLRHSLCGHWTQRGVSPSRLRYLLTRPGGVGRCTNLDAATCTASSDCGAGSFCLGGHCAPATEPSCRRASDCAAGTVCLGGTCQSGPACLSDGDCASLLPGLRTACVDQPKHWCRNDPSVACTTHADCPVCPKINGLDVPCRRVCAPEQLKGYFSGTTVPGGSPSAELTDLFRDPDEHGLHGSGRGTLTGDLSRVGGPYSAAISAMNCCVDAWWPAPAAQGGTLCSGACPSDLVCNQ
jgi:hypothetical protein